MKHWRKPRSNIGDESAFLSGFGNFDSKKSVPTWGGKDESHWKFELNDFAAYDEIASKPMLGIYENAIYSPEGKWGVMISDAIPKPTLPISRS